MKRRPALAVGVLGLHLVALALAWQGLAAPPGPALQGPPALAVALLRPTPTPPAPPAPPVSPADALPILPAPPALPALPTLPLPAVLLQGPEAATSPAPSASPPTAAAAAAVGVAVGVAAAPPAPADSPALALPPAAPAVQQAQARREACPPASYPAPLRERGIEGEVQLLVRVDTEGRAAEVRLQQASGWRLFDQAALARAQACRFVPARRGTQAEESWVVFPVRFALQG